MAHFEKITQYKDEIINPPSMQTEDAAGYDFCASEDILIPSFITSSLKMLFQVYSNDTFIQKMTNTQIIKLIKTQQFDDQEKIKAALLEIYPLIMAERILNLDEMKTVSKESNAKLSLIPTGIKACLDVGTYLQLSLRSSIPMSSYIMLGNGVGIIDRDYYNNESNEGHIFFQVINFSPFDIQIKKGDRIGQGVILDYKKTQQEDNQMITKRVGGFGSTSS